MGALRSRFVPKKNFFSALLHKDDKLSVDISCSVQQRTKTVVEELGATLHSGIFEPSLTLIQKMVLCILSGVKVHDL